MKTNKLFAFALAVAMTFSLAACGNNVTEMVEQFEDRGGRNRVRVFLFDTFDFVGYSPVHLLGGVFIDMAEGVLEGIFAYPYGCSQVVVAEIFFGGGHGVCIGVLFQSCSRLFFFGHGISVSLVC